MPGVVQIGPFTKQGQTGFEKGPGHIRRKIFFRYIQ